MTQERVQMSRMFLAPSRYVQGAGAIAEIGIHAARMGTKALFTGGKTALNVCGSMVEASLKDNKVGCHKEVFNGECSDKEIGRLVSVAKANGADLVIAAGGGKVIDTGKAMGHEMKIPVIVAPTIAATDAPCSALSVIYSEHGVFERYLLLPKNPDCVLVDTTLVANAPVELLVSGMGDALATYWEADTCAKSCKPNALTGACPPTLSSLALARLCYDTLLEYGLQAKLAVEKKSVTPAVEAVVEANTLLSGLGFESGGLAGSSRRPQRLDGSGSVARQVSWTKGGFRSRYANGPGGPTVKRRGPSPEFLLERGVAGLFGGSGRIRPEPRGHKESSRGNHGGGRDYSFHLVPRDR